MNIYLEKIQQLLEKSLVSDETSYRLLLACASIDEEKLQDLVEICEKKSGIIEKLAENFAKKIRAIESGDMEKWKEIISEEISEIEDMEKIAMVQDKLAQ